MWTRAHRGEEVIQRRAERRAEVPVERARHVRVGIAPLQVVQQLLWLQPL